MTYYAPHKPMLPFHSRAPDINFTVPLSRYLTLRRQKYATNESHHNAAQLLLNGDVRERQAEAQRAGPPVVREGSQGPAVSNHHKNLRRKYRRKHVPPTTLAAKNRSLSTNLPTKPTPSRLQLSAQEEENAD